MSGGDIAVGGDFQTPGGIISPYSARYSFGGTAPGIIAQPVSASTCGPGGAAFSLTGTGTGQLEYRWQIRTDLTTWVNLPNGVLYLPCGGSVTADTPDTPQLNIGMTPCGGVNQYQLRCIVSNACGTVMSDTASLTVNSADFDGDGDSGTDADIQAFFSCLSGNCCATCGSGDFNGDGDVATSADIEGFFRVLAGGPC
jgi:hypothetical protein